MAGHRPGQAPLPWPGPWASVSRPKSRRRRAGRVARNWQRPTGMAHLTGVAAVHARSAETALHELPHAPPAAEGEFSV